MCDASTKLNFSISHSLYFQNLLFLPKNMYFWGDKTKNDKTMSLSAHQDFKGHHPKIRIYIAHYKGGGPKLRILRTAYDAVRQLLMRTEDSTMPPAILAILSALGEGALPESTAVAMGCADSGFWYVDTAGCATLQANDANPPPRHGFVRTAMQYAAVLLLGLMMLVGSASCKKDPQPNPAPNPVPTDTVTPITPVDTITPIVPGDTITPTPGDTIVPEPPMPMDTVSFFINLKNNNIQYPSMDTLRKLVGLNKVIVLRWKIPPNLTRDWTPQEFQYPRDSLKPRFALSQQIFGQGTIFVNKDYGGASIPCADSLNISILGMTECDKEIFTGWGFEVNDEYAKSQREEHFKMLDTIGMSRAILGKQH